MENPLGCCPQLSQATWTPPSTSCFKVNFDGAMFEKEGSVGLGVVIWNGDGQVMASLSQLVPLPHSVIEVEALVARRGVELTLNDGCRSLFQYGHIVIYIHYLASQFLFSIYLMYIGTVTWWLTLWWEEHSFYDPCPSRWKMYLQMTLMYYMLI